MSIFKNFTITRGFTPVPGGILNVFNHPVYGNPNVALIAAAAADYRLEPTA